MPICLCIDCDCFCATAAISTETVWLIKLKMSGFFLACYRKSLLTPDQEHSPTSSKQCWTQQSTYAKRVLFFTNWKTTVTPSQAFTEPVLCNGLWGRHARCRLSKTQLPLSWSLLSKRRLNIPWKYQSRSPGQTKMSRDIGASHGSWLRVLIS